MCLHLKTSQWSLIKGLKHLSQDHRAKNTSLWPLSLIKKEKPFLSFLQIHHPKTIKRHMFQLLIYI